MSRLPTTSMIGRGPAKPPKSGKWLIVGGAIGIVAIVLIAILASVILSGPGDTPAKSDVATSQPATKSPPQPSAPGTQPATKTEASAAAPSARVAQMAEPQAAGPALVDDDGKTLWES